MKVGCRVVRWTSVGVNYPEHIEEGTVEPPNHHNQRQNKADQKSKDLNDLNPNDNLQTPIRVQKIPATPTPMIQVLISTGNRIECDRRKEKEDGDPHHLENDKDNTSEYADRKWNRYSGYS